MIFCLARACRRFVYSPTYSACKLAAPNACHASPVTGPISDNRFYSQMKELLSILLLIKAFTYFIFSLRTLWGYVNSHYFISACIPGFLTGLISAVA